MSPLFRKWARICLFNFLIVSALGMVLRYKIILPLPWVQQKLLLYGHSHFAFAGWVSLALFTATLTLFRQPGDGPAREYRNLFYLGLVSAYGMLLTFPFFGYKLPSFVFSTLSILFSYLLAWRVWRDAARGSIPAGLSKWFRAALVFYVISSFGTYALAILMQQKGLAQEWYIGSLYFFLHFQYNGWFFFAMLGCLEGMMVMTGATAGLGSMTRAFRYFTWATVPSFFLSALWMQLPAWLYALAVLSVALLGMGVFHLFAALRASAPQLKASLQRPVRMLWSLSATALMIKFILQGLSLVPDLTTYAFGFRPIVIGFLHLVLLGMVSFFLVGLFIQEGLLRCDNRLARTGLWTFVTGVIVNESILMAQGIFGIAGDALPYGNEYLFVAAGTIFSGLLMLNMGQGKL
jgi:hypothetical protein